jgi:hypothetical protein
MNEWDTPDFEEIAMNAEIGSYQDDLDRPVDPDWVDDDDREE